jgi:mycothiol maleylpyruvate isomerase-like protein/putative zinc finger protein
MNDAHAAVTELLGAWALDACSVQEAATVEDHVANCPACTAEADRLGRAAAGEEASTGYAAWVDRFDTLLESLTPAQWRERVIHDWTVQDLVAHLFATDELLVVQLAPAGAKPPEDPAELDGALPARRTAAAIGEHRGRPPEHTRAAWRAQADRLLRAATTLGCD